MLPLHHPIPEPRNHPSFELRSAGTASFTHFRVMCETKDGSKRFTLLTRYVVLCDIHTLSRCFRNVNILLRFSCVLFAMLA